MTKGEKLAALDAAFDSAENQYSGRMQHAEYQTRRRAIEAEPVEPPPTRQKQRGLAPWQAWTADAVGRLLARVLTPLERRQESTDLILDDIERRLAALEKQKN